MSTPRQQQLVNYSEECDTFYNKLSRELQEYIPKNLFFRIWNDILSLYDSEIPYHSQLHAIDVATTGYHYIKTILKNIKETTTRLLPSLLSFDKIEFEELKEPKNMITFLFALLGHDAGHPGLGNISRIEEIKREYKLSYLEEYHYILTKEILEKYTNHSSSSSSSSSEYEFEYNDSILHSVILATNSSIPPKNPLEMMIQLSDINHTISSLEKHCVWSMKLSNELPISMKPKPEEQVNFFKRMIYNLVETALPFLQETSPELYEILQDNYKRNLEYWISQC
jgi:hypothetical protein